MEIGDIFIYIYYKYSTLPRGISINIAPKVGIFPVAEGRGKYSLPSVQYYRYYTRKGGIFILLHRLTLYNCANLLQHQSRVILDSYTIVDLANLQQYHRCCHITAY